MKIAFQHAVNTAKISKWLPLNRMRLVATNGACNIYCRLMAVIFDLPVTLTSESIHISHIVLLDPENGKYAFWGVCFRISLLSCIQAEIFDTAYVLLINGGNLQLTSYSDVGEYLHQSHRIAGSPKWCYMSQVKWYHIEITTYLLHPVSAAILICLWAWLGILWDLRH